jgi:ethanolamine utilization microcompartment shell protein EutL
MILAPSSATRTGVGDGLGLGDTIAVVVGAVVSVAVAAKVAVGVATRVAVGAGVDPSTGTNPAPPLGEGWRLAGISEQATTITARRAVTIGRRPTERGCYLRRAS